MSNNNIKELELQKLINEMIFLKEDLKLKKEISKVIEEDFNNHLNKIISSDDILKEQWNSSVNNINNYKKASINRELYKKKNNVSDSMKKIYRDIAKITHPDKTDDNEKHNTYKKVTESYEKDDLIELLFYAKQLGVEYDHNTLDVTKMKENILDIKANISTYENSISFKWYYNDMNEDIIKNYIATQFIKNI